LGDVSSSVFGPNSASQPSWRSDWNHAAHATAGFINRDRDAPAFQVKRRSQPRDAGPDDGDGFHSVQEK